MPTIETRASAAESIIARLSYFDARQALADLDGEFIDPPPYTPDTDGVQEICAIARWSPSDREHVLDLLTTRKALLLELRNRALALCNIFNYRRRIHDCEKYLAQFAPGGDPRTAERLACLRSRVSRQRALMLLVFIPLVLWGGVRGCDSWVVARARRLEEAKAKAVREKAEELKKTANQIKATEQRLQRLEQSIPTMPAKNAQREWNEATNQIHQIEKQIKGHTKTSAVGLQTIFAAVGVSLKSLASGDSTNADQEPELLRQLEILKAKAAELEKRIQTKAEAEAKAQRKAEAEANAEAQRKAQAEAKAREEARVKAEAEAKAEVERKAQAEAKAREEARVKAEAEAKAEAQRKAQAEAKAREEARVKAEAEAKAEAQRKAQAEAKAREEARVKAEAEAREAARLKAQAEASALAEKRLHILRGIDDEFVGLKNLGTVSDKTRRQLLERLDTLAALHSSSFSNASVLADKVQYWRNVVNAKPSRAASNSVGDQVR
jgi:membrane protein involved in colicin uptake